jgi:hypothetical protein
MACVSEEPLESGTEVEVAAAVDVAAVPTVGKWCPLSAMSKWRYSQLEEGPEAAEEEERTVVTAGPEAAEEEERTVVTAPTVTVSLKFLSLNVETMAMMTFVTLNLNMEISAEMMTKAAAIWEMMIWYFENVSVPWAKLLATGLAEGCDAKTSHGQHARRVGSSRATWAELAEQHTDSVRDGPLNADIAKSSLVTLMG